MSKNFILIEIEQLPMGAPDHEELKVALEHLMFAFGAVAKIDNLSEDELKGRLDPDSEKTDSEKKIFDWDESGIWSLGSGDEEE